MHFDRFDVCEAYYLFGSLYHGGMGTKEYGYVSRVVELGFKPAPLLDAETLTENGRAIFDGLIERGGFPPWEYEGDSKE